MLVDSVKNQGVTLQQSVQNQNVQRRVTSESDIFTDAAMTAQGGADQGKVISLISSQEKELSEKKIKAVMDDTNNKLKNTRTRCEFSYHEETNRVSIKVIDKSTDELIREIPPEKTLEVLEKVWEIAGLLVDEKR